MQRLLGSDGLKEAGWFPSGIDHSSDFSAPKFLKSERLRVHRALHRNAERLKDRICTRVGAAFICTKIYSFVPQIVE